MGETKEARAARLAAALRENLKRRKAQSRERAAETETPTHKAAARGAED